jgi:hypothetical protein
MELNSPPVAVEYAFNILQNKRSIDNISSVRSDHMNYICQDDKFQNYRTADFQ